MWQLTNRLRPMSTNLLLDFVVVLLLLSHHNIVAYDPLRGVRLTSLNSKQPVDLLSFLSRRGVVVDQNQGRKGYSLLIFGTYPADFNCIEYSQRLRYYLPQLRDRGVVNFGMIVNGDERGARTLAECVDLPLSEVDIFLDPSGIAGRAFGVERGWRPDDDNLSPFLKLFGMLWGLGAWATLPCVIGGYLGNPFRAQPWIEDAMAVGQMQQRWPNTALELKNNGEEGGGSTVIRNKFSELPLVGGWKRRPLELATLRLQNMLGISIQRWDQLKPTEVGFQSGVLTQLGGCLIMETTAMPTDKPVVEWRDPGICAVANFEDILEKLPSATTATAAVL